MLKKGLRQKTFIFTLSVITLVIVVSFGVLYFVLPGYYLRQKSDILQSNTESLAQSLLSAQSDTESAELIAAFAQNNNANVAAFDENNSLIPFLSTPFIFRNDMGVVDSYYINTAGMRDAGRPAADSEELDGALFFSSLRIRSPHTGEGIRFELIEGGPGHERLLYLQRHNGLQTLTKPIGSGVIDHIIVSATLQPIHEAQGVVLSLMPYIFLIAFLIALGAAYLFTRQLTRPILQISKAAARMQDMTPDALSNLGTKDELGRLSENLDALYTSLLSNIQSLTEEMERAEKLERSKTEFMRSAGHELKTPIAALNGIIEGMIDNVGVYKNRDKYLTECKGQISKLSRLVHEILSASALSGTESREAVCAEETDVSALLSEALAPYRLIIERKGLHLITDDFSYTAVTDRKLLLHSLSNLISNAVNYTEDRGSIRIHFKDKTLSVENDCSVPDVDLEKLFEPFYTLSYSRDKVESGTGLGLYIVKRNLELLSLPYQMEHTGRGLKFSISFEGV